MSALPRGGGAPPWRVSAGGRRAGASDGGRPAGVAAAAAAAIGPRGRLLPLAGRERRRGAGPGAAGSSRRPGPVACSTS